MSKSNRDVNLDQLRGIVHYPYNCGACMSEDISRGQVVGTYLHNNCPEDVAAAFGPKITVHGRTYLVADFVDLISSALPTED